MEDIRFEEGYTVGIQSVGFVNVERDNGYTFEYKDGKTRFSFIFVEKGDLEYEFPSQKILISDGHVLFVPKHLPYKATYLDNGVRIKILLFDIPAENAPFPLDKPFVKNSSEFQKEFHFLNAQNSRNALLLTSKVYQLLCLLQSENQTLPPKYRKIMPALTEIDRNYFENHKISVYADMCNMSESNFRKLFREYTKKSPIEYRNFIRITEFKKRMASGEFTVNEAAYSVGFNNMSFFYEVYNKHFK
ncbi:MAG: helix-turn-helix transcriptional regulator [Clostridia bacterium]|nr:helix-turn-helix transcriptional regulator [Clostridia bacterium]